MGWLHWLYGIKLFKLFILKKTAIRAIFQIDKRNSCAPHFKGLKILTLPSIYLHIWGLLKNVLHEKCYDRIDEFLHWLFIYCFVIIIVIFCSFFPGMYDTKESKKNYYYYYARWHPFYIIHSISVGMSTWIFIRTSQYFFLYLSL